MTTGKKAWMEIGGGLRVLSKGAYDDAGFVGFKRQIEQFAWGRLASEDHIVITEDSTPLGIEQFNGRPLVMTQSTLRKIVNEHDIGLDQIVSLPEWLLSHPLAMQSLTRMGTVVVVCDAVDVHGNDIIAAVQVDAVKQGLAICELASAYGKRNLEYLITNTVRAGLEVYTNERTNGWILRTGLRLPEQIASRLSNCTRNNGSRRIDHDSWPNTPQAEIEADISDAASAAAGTRFARRMGR